MSNLFLCFILILSTPFTYQREEIVKATKSADTRGDIFIAFGNDYVIDEEIQTDMINYIKIKKPDVFIFVGHVPLPRFELQAALNTLPTTTFVTGVFYQDEYEDFDRFYRFTKESSDSHRWKSKSSYYSLLIQAPVHKFPTGTYVKVIMLDLEVDFTSQSGKKELEWLERELYPDSSIAMYLIVGNLQFFSLGKIYEIEISTEMRMTLMNTFMRVPQPILFASTTGLGPYGEIINYPCDEMYRKVVEISSRGMNAEVIPRFEILNKILVPEISSKKKDRVFVNNYGTIDVHLDIMNLGYSYVWIKLLSEKNEILLSQRLEFSDLKQDLKKTHDNFKCSRDLANTVQRKILQNVLKNPYFWISMMSLFLPPILIYFMWKARGQGGAFGGMGGGYGGYAGGYGDSDGSSWGWKSEFEAYHGAY